MPWQINPKVLWGTSKFYEQWDEVKRRILIGTYVLSAGFYDAYYKKAQQSRRMIKNDFVEAFKNVDVIMSPSFQDLSWRWMWS